MRLGLTTYEAKTYLALVRRDSYTAAQVARQAGVPRQRIYDVLSSLVQKGLATARLGTVVKYAATAPQVAVSLLVGSQRRQLAEMEEDARMMVVALTPAFEAGQAHTEPLDYIEILRDRRAIRERLAELEASVQRELLVFAKPPYVQQLHEGSERHVARRSHKARLIYELGVLDDPAALEGVRRSLESGDEARFVPDLLLNLVIVDEALVMLGMEDPVAGEADLTSVVVEHSSLAKVLKTAFEATWQTALTFEQGRDVVETPGTGSAERTSG